MEQKPVIVWFRRDLRIQDNPALFEAAKTGAPVLPLYIDETDRERGEGAASRLWLHYSLSSLKSDMGGLTVQQGKAKTIIETLAKTSGAQAVFWNRRYGRDREIDAAIKTSLTGQGVEVRSFNGNLLSEPWEIKSKTGKSYYKVFSPYWRAVLAQVQIPGPLPAPKLKLYEPAEDLEISDLDLLPKTPDWGAKMLSGWQIGEAGAKAALTDFLDGPAADYKADRDRADKPEGTSKLSPHLAFGEISPRQIWHATKARDVDGGKFLSEVGWREFSYCLLYHNQDLRTRNFKPAFDGFPWSKNEAFLTAWQKGQTGYPFVDAGMRELWQTGYMHNRVRMVAASFLIKHLMIDWREGESWFWDTLFDADPANNAASWQWVAGSGADAAPYFRIFNPFGQGEKFDPNGDYVRKWAPELKRLPNKFIHRPWEAPEPVLKEANVRLGETYPRPIVDHKQAREAALSAYKMTRG